MADEAKVVVKTEPTLGEKLMFSLPAIVIALLLAVGISYGILTMMEGETRKQLGQAQAQLTKETNDLREDLKKVDQQRMDLETKVKTLTDHTATLEKEKTELATKLATTSASFEKVATDFGAFTDSQKNVDTVMSKDIAKHEGNINALETKVRYIDDKLKKLDELALEINGLKSDTSGLHKDYAALKGDLTSVRNKTEITEQDIKDLTDRARMFQMRVLAARAREAAEAARQTDLKSLLNRLDDVEDK